MVEMGFTSVDAVVHGALPVAATVLVLKTRRIPALWRDHDEYYWSIAKFLELRLGRLKVASKVLVG